MVVVRSVFVVDEMMFVFFFHLFPSSFIFFFHFSSIFSHFSSIFFDFSWLFIVLYMEFPVAPCQGQVCQQRLGGSLWLGHWRGETGTQGLVDDKVRLILTYLDH